jgi:hypothetical protein
MHQPQRNLVDDEAGGAHSREAQEARFEKARASSEMAFTEA